MKRNFEKGGFTLIEILVVIVIIVIMTGIVFRMSRPAGDVALRGQTLAQLELMKTILEEFNSEFGTYPPVKAIPFNSSKPDGPYYQPVSYTFPSGFDMQRVLNMPKIFEFGLLSFIIPRTAMMKAYKTPSSVDFLAEIGIEGSTLNNLWREGGSTYFKDGRPTDTSQVNNFFKRIRPYLSQLTGVKDADSLKFARLAITKYAESEDVYTNFYFPLKDAWEVDFVYVSPPPYRKYTLFSCGPDRSYDKDFPEDRDRPLNRDNIYGDVGHN